MSGCVNCAGSGAAQASAAYSSRPAVQPRPPEPQVEAAAKAQPPAGQGQRVDVSA
jgi:hypothetical protein